MFWYNNNYYFLKLTGVVESGTGVQKSSCSTKWCEGVIGGTCRVRVCLLDVKPVLEQPDRLTVWFAVHGSFSDLLWNVQCRGLPWFRGLQLEGHVRQCPSMSMALCGGGSHDWCGVQARCPHTAHLYSTLSRLPCTSFPPSLADSSGLLGGVLCFSVLLGRCIFKCISFSWGIK